MEPLSAVRVLHVPAAVGGNPQALARAERELGLESISVALEPSPFGYQPDDVLRPPGTSRLRYEVRRLHLLLRAVRDFDVIHFNFGRSMLPKPFAYRDVALLRRVGKVIAVTFQGDDVRRGDVIPEGQSLQTALPERYGRVASEERRRRAAIFEQYAHAIWYLNPDLSRVLPARARFMPYAHVDPRVVVPRDRSGRDRRPFVVVHAPSDRDVKGTVHVVAAVETLVREGHDLTLRIVEGVTNAEALAAYAKADLAIDQLYAGWYGGFAVEAMAVGVPVVTYIRQSDLQVLDADMRQELPVVSATPETLTDALRRIVAADAAEREALASASRRYVERWHDPLAIARMVRASYVAALEKGIRT